MNHYGPAAKIPPPPPHGQRGDPRFSNGPGPGIMSKNNHNMGTGMRHDPRSGPISSAPKHNNDTNGVPNNINMNIRNNNSSDPRNANNTMTNHQDKNGRSDGGQVNHGNGPPRGPPLSLDGPKRIGGPAPGHIGPPVHHSRRAPGPGPGPGNIMTPPHYQVAPTPGPPPNGRQLPPPPPRQQSQGQQQQQQQQQHQPHGNMQLHQRPPPPPPPMHHQGQQQQQPSPHDQRGYGQRGGSPGANSFRVPPSMSGPGGNGNMMSPPHPSHQQHMNRSAPPGSGPVRAIPPPPPPLHGNNTGHNSQQQQQHQHIHSRQSMSMPNSQSSYHPIQSHPMKQNNNNNMNNNNNNNNMKNHNMNIPGNIQNLQQNLPHQMHTSGTMPNHDHRYNKTSAHNTPGPPPRHMQQGLSMTNAGNPIHTNTSVGPSHRDFHQIPPPPPPGMPNNNPIHPNNSHLMPNSNNGHPMPYRPIPPPNSQGRSQGQSSTNPPYVMHMNNKPPPSMGTSLTNNMHSNPGGHIIPPSQHPSVTMNQSPGQVHHYQQQQQQYTQQGLMQQSHPHPPPRQQPQSQFLLQQPHQQAPLPPQQQQQQQLHASSQTATIAAPTQAENPSNLAANWSTHKSPTGVNYYYNLVTQISTYDRPSCLPPTTSGIAVQIPATSNVTNSHNRPLSPSIKAAISQQKSNGSSKSKTKKRSGGGGKWTEYTDQASGKKYYFDGTKTTWDKPADFDDDFGSKKKKKKSGGDSDQEHLDETPKKKKKKDKKKSSSSDDQVVFNNKAEAIAAFKGLLLAKDVSPTAKWNDVVKICSSDPRWEACSTAGERKQALAEYQSKRANDLREQKRQEKIRAKDAFMALLTDVLPTVRNFHASANTRFHEVRDSLSKDDRFYAVEEEYVREEMFHEFVEEVRKREERLKRSRKRDAKDSFKAFLKYREDGGGLTFASTWSSFVSSLQEKDKLDDRFVVSPAMSDSDRQLYFADYVIELQTAEEEKTRRIRDARRRAEKAQRNAYRESIRNLAVKGKILPSSRWRNVEELLSAEESFGPVQEQDRDAPREMFEDFIDDWSDLYRRDRSFISHLLSSSKNKFVVTENTNYADFTQAILKAAEYSADIYSNARRAMNREEPISSVKVYFDELIERSKESSISRKGGGFRIRRSGGRGAADESSEDEGEIREDEEGEEKEEQKTEVIGGQGEKEVVAVKGEEGTA